MGEWACYGVGNRLMFGFTLQRDGSYLDGDQKKAGAYTYNSGAATIAFRGGPMDGQTGRKASATGFELSRTVSCELFR